MTVRRWESGLREPRASDIKKLCEVLRVTEDELLNGPKSNEIKIIINWEVDEVNDAAIRTNEVFLGYNSATDSLIFRGSVPANASNEEILEAIAKNLSAARAGRDAFCKTAGEEK